MYTISKGLLSHHAFLARVPCWGDNCSASSLAVFRGLNLLHDFLEYGIFAHVIYALNFFDFGLGLGAIVWGNSYNLVEKFFG
ncbi:hypothetical protein BGS_1015 [Beggiatoa sp. SS]|nr:hypothetical protein BGS_1015 [Beggiatoa sp. SS]